MFSKKDRAKAKQKCNTTGDYIIPLPPAASQLLTRNSCSILNGAKVTFFGRISSRLITTIEIKR